jgi:hypothetical protein
MHNHRFSPIDRRGFLRLGALAGVLCAAGCDSASEPKTITSPPIESGTRKRLKMIEDKAAEGPKTKKK